MNELQVEIVVLEPMRVASLYGFGAAPELIAWDKLNTWAGPLGLLEKPGQHRIFGFNNPNPSAGSPNYGYELWIEIGPEIEPEDDMRVQDFLGGLYAVARCPVPEENFAIIGDTWKKLATWLEESPYKHGGHQWLEKTVPGETPGLAFTLDLYLPIIK